jgi:uncharacterized protein YhaN
MTAIRGWSIDGGAFFPGCTVSALPDGLTVLHGANEAGKSTILEFVRRVLFGAPRAVTDALAQVSQRGCVVIDDGSGELVVERDLERAPPVVRRLDGGAVDAGELHRMLGGADERLFRTVFAFSLDDLQSLATLDAAGVHEALFSASLAGAGRSAASAVRALRADAAARVRGEGAAQASRLIIELNALRPRLNAARRAALAYVEQRAAADRLAGAVEAQRAAVAARRAAHRRDDALLRAWPAWVALQAARAELAELEPAADVPAETEAQLGAARERLGIAQGAVRALRAQRAEAEQGVALLPADGSVAPALAAEVETLHAALPLYRFQRAALPEAHARRDAAARLLAERIGCVGGEWPADRLRGWGGAAAQRERVRDWQVQLRAAAQRVDEARARLEGAATVHAAVRREYDQTAAELSASAASGADDIGRQSDGLGELRRTIEEMLVRRSHGEASAQTRRDRGVTLRALEIEHDPPLPAWLVGGPAAVAAASAAAAGWSIAYGGPLSGLAALALAGVAAAVAYWLAAQRRARTQREEERQAARRRVRAEMEAARRARDEAWHRAAELAGQVARQAEALGLPSSPDGADLDARERALAAAAAAAERAMLLVRTRLARDWRSRCNSAPRMSGRGPRRSQRPQRRAVRWMRNGPRGAAPQASPPTRCPTQCSSGSTGWKRRAQRCRPTTRRCTARSPARPWSPIGRRARGLCSPARVRPPRKGSTATRSPNACSRCGSGHRTRWANPPDELRCWRRRAPAACSWPRRKRRPCAVRRRSTRCCRAPGRATSPTS